MPVPFDEQLHEFHQTLLNGSDEELLDRVFREELASLIQEMTNMDTYAKRAVFHDLVSCHSELDYKLLASTLKR